MQIYSSPDMKSHPFNGSLIYLSTSIFVFMFLITQKINISKIVKWINIVVVISFAIFAILLAMICIYASPDGDQIYPLASAIFSAGGFVAMSSIFLIGRLEQNITNKTQEMNK